MKYIIILGYRVNRDGSLSEILKNRIDKGIRIFRSQNNSKIVLTGGKVNSKHAEGEVMKRYCNQKGIPDDRLIIENKATRTFENALFSYQMIKDQGIEKVFVVTSKFHSRRTSKIFKYIFHNVEVEISASDTPKMNYLKLCIFHIYDIFYWLYLTLKNLNPNSN